MSEERALNLGEGIDDDRGSVIHLATPVAAPNLRLASTAVDVDELIGKLDRHLSEMLLASQHAHLNVVDATTIKHHARDLVNGGNRVLEVLKERGIE